MKYTKLMMATLIVGLLTLNGCMLKHVLDDEDGGMSMPMHGMMHDDEADMHEGMTMEHSDEDEDE